MSQMPDYTPEQKDAIVSAAWAWDLAYCREVNPKVRQVIDLHEALHPNPGAREVAVERVNDRGNRWACECHGPISRVLVDGVEVWPKEGR